jgi:protein O-mannosyl-transferase
MKSKKPIILPVVVLIITLIASFPSLFNGFFCWDDKDVPLAPFVHILNFTNIGKYFSTFHAGLYHPLTTLSFAIDYVIGNGTAFPFHVTNLLLHLVNTLLIFILIKKLFGNQNMAFFVALLFGLHPMHVEAVAWITSRKDLLYVLFFLGSLISYTGYLDTAKKKYYALSLILFLFSCLSKIQGAVLPLILFLVDYLRNRKLYSKRTLLEKVPFLMVALLFGIINIIAQKGYGYIDYKAPFSIFERLIIFCYGFEEYIFRILIPLKISVFYPFPFHPGDEISFVYFLYPLILLLFFAGTFFFIYRNKRIFVFGSVFFFICIFLVLIINNYRETIITDRYTYLGSVGVFIVLAATGMFIFERFRQFKWILIAGAFLYILFFSQQTFERNRLWHSPANLVESAMTIYPASPILLNTRGSLAIDSGDYRTAISFLDKAILTNTKFPYAWYHKGLAETKLEMYQQALHDFSQAVKLNPAFTDAYFGRANVYRNLGDDQKANDDYSLVLKMNPDYFGAWENRAIVKGNHGDYKGALEDLDHAIELNPAFGASWYLRGIAKFEIRINGCDDLRKAIALGYQQAQKALDFYCR